MANGTPGEIRECHFKSGTTFTKSKIFDFQCLICMSGLLKVVYFDFPLLLKKSSKMETVPAHF